MSMEQEEIIKERKKVIAIFDGSMLIRDYNSNWNDIMPVVKKIQKLQITEFFLKKPVMDALMDVDINSLFIAIYGFANWYNSKFNEKTT